MKITWAMDPSNTQNVPIVGTTTPTQGQGRAWPSGLLQNGCGTLYFINKSNVVIYVLFEDGSVSEIPAWWARPYKPKTRSDQLWLSQGAVLNTQGPPISQLTLESFQPNEDSTGLYSGPITYQTNIGGGALSQATQVIQTGQVAPTPVLEATPNNNFNAAPQVLESVINNDGTFFLGDNGTLLSAQGMAVQSISRGILSSAQFVASQGTSVPVVSFLGRAPVQLQAGNQETGWWGVDVQFSAANQIAGQGVNFKTTLTNTPTSITLSPSFMGNISNNATSGLTKLGFGVEVTSTAAGRGFQYGSYTTVGN